MVPKRESLLYYLSPIFDKRSPVFVERDINSSDCYLPKCRAPAQFGRAALMIIIR